MDGATLEKLKVVFEAQYSQYKKDMDHVRSETKKVSQAVDAEKARINKAFASVSTQKAQKEMNRLQEQLQKQREAVTSQEAVLQNLKNQYQDLMNGITQDKAETGLEKQMASAQKELDKMYKQMQPFLSMLAQAQKGMKFPESELDKAHGQIQAMLPAYTELEAHIAQLKKQLADVRMNPESTTTAEQFRQKIELAQDRLQRLQTTAAETEQQIEKTMRAGSGSSLKAKLNGIISKFRQMGSSSRTGSRDMHSGFSKVSAGIDSLRKRITGMVGSAVVFNLFSKGLAAGKETLGKYLKTNDQFNSSLTATKSNLQTAFMPLYNVALPAINAIMEKMEKLSQYLAIFSATVFGTTYSASKKAAEGINKASNALDGYAGKSEGLGLASFDKLNNLNSSDSGGAGTSIAATVVDGSAMDAMSRFKELLDKLKAGTESFRNAVKRLWDGGLSKLKNFTWQGLKDFWENFLKPLGKWAFGTDGKGLTRLVDILNDDLNRVPWDEINENLSEFWAAIEPYAENVGEGLIDFFEDCGDIGVDILIKLFGDDGIMPKMTDWLNNNDPEKARIWGYDLGLLVTALAGFTAASKIVEVVGHLRELLVVLGGLKGLGTIAIVVTVAVGGFKLGKKLGKLINPEDSDLYDSFHWTGKGGFFDTVSEDWSSNFDALINMASDFENNPVIAGLTTFLTAGFLTSPEGSVFAVSFFKQEFDRLKDEIGLDTDEIKEKWNGALEDTKSKFREWKDDKVGKLKELKKDFKEKIEDFKKTISDFKDDVKEGVPKAFKTGFKNAANLAAEQFNKFIDFLNDKMHFEWDAIKIAGKEIVAAGSIQLFTIPHIPKLAKGGIVQSSTLLEAGEAGREAILPLENNTGWMQTFVAMLVRELAGTISHANNGKGMTVNVYLEGDAKKFLRIMRIEDEKFYGRNGHSNFNEKYYKNS